MPGPEEHRPDLPRLIIRLSGGRMGCAQVLARAAIAGSRPGHPPGPDLLTRAVTDELLDMLLPTKELRDDLSLLAPALEEPAALPLWRELGAPGLADLKATARLRDALDEVSGEHWNQDSWAWPADEPAGSPGCPDRRVPFVGDHALRALLLHQLATTGEPGRWATIHRRLRDGYNPRHLAPGAVGHTTAYLHHTLALGEPAMVVRGLHDRLTRIEPDHWLASVNVICAAPQPPGGPPAAEPAGPCPACGGPEPDQRHEAIDQLVRNLWRASDPRTLAGSEAVNRIESALHVLYGQRQDPFLWAVKRWPAALRDGDQAPYLPVPSGSIRSSTGSSTGGSQG